MYGLVLASDESPLVPFHQELAQISDGEEMASISCRPMVYKVQPVIVSVALSGMTRSLNEA
jgi:hypothetical protein